MGNQAQDGAFIRRQQPGVNPRTPTPNPSNELVQYFINMGINPVTAAELAGQIAVAAPPRVPISNGVQLTLGKTNMELDPEVMDMIAADAKTPGPSGPGYLQHIGDSVGDLASELVDPAPRYQHGDQTVRMTATPGQPPRDGGTVHMMSHVKAPPSAHVKMDYHVNAPNVVHMASRPGYTVEPVPIADQVDHAIESQHQAGVDQYEGGSGLHIPVSKEEDALRDEELAWWRARSK